MNEHALDAMIYAWQVMKEKEENKMEGIFLGQAVDGVFSIDKTKLTFEHERRTHESHSAIRYSDCYYVLVESDDVIKTNDELLKLRDKVTKLEAELAEIKTTRTLREAYIVGVEKGCESLREERDRWKNRCNSVMTDISNALSANGVEFVLKEIDGDGNWDVVIDIPELNEAKDKIVELEQKVRDERKWCDYWRHTYNSAEKAASVVGVSIKIDGIESQHNSAKVVVQNDKAEELKKQVVQMEDLEKKLKAAKSNENYWRDRKEEEEDYHHYWMHTFNRAVTQAEQKGVYIGVRGTDEDRNAGIVVVDNMKAEELEKQVVQMEKTNNNLNQKIGAADNALEYWNNTYNDIVIAGKNVGVKIDIKGKKPDSNAGFVYVTNETGLGLAYKLSDMNHRHDEKWRAMLDALKEKGVEVIYMGEEDDKPIIDIKVPGWDEDKEWVTTFSKRVADLLADKFGLESERDELKEQCDILRKDGALKGQQCLKLKADLNDLKKEYGRVLSELAELKSKTVAEARYEWKPGCFTMIYTMCDGSKQTTGADLSHEHINCLCKNYVDTESISHGTIPKCSSCSHFMHNPSRFAHDWCYMPHPKEGGAGYIRKLNKEEAEGPACSDFKARKE